MPTKRPKTLISRINRGSRPQDALSIWAVYRCHQSGVTRFIARQYAVDPQGQSFVVSLLQSDDITEMRGELFRRGLTVVERQDASDPQIVEVWL